MDDLAVLAIPAVLVAGLVLVGLGADGRAKGSGSRRWTGRFQDWATQAGVRGVRLWQVVAVCGGAGVAVGMAVLVLTRSLWLGLAFARLAGWLPLGALRARRRGRLRELREVWPDAIDNLASGVRAGLSLPEAVAGLAERGPGTLRAPFARFADDYHATGRFGTALDRLKDELADPTADRVIEALRLGQGGRRQRARPHAAHLVGLPPRRAAGPQGAGGPPDLGGGRGPHGLRDPLGGPAAARDQARGGRRLSRPRRRRGPGDRHRHGRHRLPRDAGHRPP